MMIRTQIYLPEKMHQDLRSLAEVHNTTLSELIRVGAEKTIKKMSQKKPKKSGFSYFAHLPKSHLFRSSMSAVDLVRAERD